MDVSMASVNEVEWNTFLNPEYVHAESDPSPNGNVPQIAAFPVESDTMSYQEEAVVTTGPALPPLTDLRTPSPLLEDDGGSRFGPDLEMLDLESLGVNSFDTFMNPHFDPPAPGLSNLTADNLASQQEEFSFHLPETHNTKSDQPIHIVSLEEPNQLGARKGKRRRTRISHEAKSILEDHFHSDPYPSKMQRGVLAELTGLTPAAVKNWYSNTRSRSDNAHPRLQASGSGAKGDCDKSSCKSVRSRLSLERYLQAPLEEEAVSAAEISTNLANSPLATKGAQIASRENWDVADSVRLAQSPTHPDSVSGASSFSYQSAASLASAHSRGSLSSFHSFGSYKFSNDMSRRGRRRWHGPASERPSTVATETDVIYYCTFAPCQSHFKSYHNWVRHEESVHFHAKTWICCRTAFSESRLGYSSSLADPPIPIFNALFASCQTKPEIERAFYRRDHLIKHITRRHCSDGHKLEHLRGYVNDWEVNVDYSQGHPSLYCGFCREQLETWQARKHHVIQHFLAGLNMQSWLQRRHYTAVLEFVPETRCYPWCRNLGHSFDYHNPLTVIYSVTSEDHSICGFCQQAIPNHDRIDHLHSHDLDLSLGGYQYLAEEILLLHVIRDHPGVTIDRGEDGWLAYLCDELDGRQQTSL